MLNISWEEKANKKQHQKKKPFVIDGFQVSLGLLITMTKYKFQVRFNSLHSCKYQIQFLSQFYLYGPDPINICKHEECYQLHTQKEFRYYHYTFIATCKIYTLIKQKQAYLYNYPVISEVTLTFKKKYILKHYETLIKSRRDIILCIE